MTVKKPDHVAIIMDGNGRWAKRHGLPRSEGHRRGMDVIREIIEEGLRLHVGYLTFYAFSTQNWKRPDKEVAFLMRGCEEIILRELSFMVKNNIRFQHIGQRENLPQSLQDVIERAMNLTRNNTKMTVLLAFNYGGREEILRGIRSIARDVRQGQMDPEAIDEQTVSRRLYTADIPDPDLLIRTSGEMRLSNFLLWQLCYTELYVTKTLWPDFRRKDFQRALLSFGQRSRRFGGIDE